ncbi:MAG TPA: ATP-binding protein [Thermodesulfobacteriota bacterium]|nr:ATP-binding protein [Thermodesulfobacteriota bacterium]
MNLGLRMEVIVNISLLMLAAILLIGITMAKIHEKNIVEEKVRYGERLSQDILDIIEFIFKERKEFSLNDFPIKQELQDFVRIFTKEKGGYDLLITDPALKIIVSKREDLVGQYSKSDSLRNSIQSGQFYTKIETSGSLLWIRYQKMVFCSPLWVHGKIVGGLQLEVPTDDIMIRLFESKKIILISILLDAVVLIIFGSLLLSRVLVKPLRDLVQLTQKISEGDFSQTIEVSSRNEISQLIDSFNRMIIRLKENQESLENYLESLETTNTKLKEAQEEILRSEKLASIGRFAAGVAHEVGNPLGAILGYTSILERGGVDHEEAKDYLKRIEKEIERINRIVRELLDFARPSKAEPKEVNVNQALENTLSLLSYQKDFKEIQTQLDLRSDLPMIRGDEAQLSQVFINIILNAVDAMPDGGSLCIQTGTYVVEHLFSDSFHWLHPPRRKGDPVESNYSHLRKPDPLSAMLTKFSKGETLIKILISDTGTGVGKEDLKRIFDPFFTTKDPDKGTGLGLSVSLRIVEAMGGEIKVESELGKGTKFEIYFPAVS